MPCQSILLSTCLNPPFKVDRSPSSGCYPTRKSKSFELLSKKIIQNGRITLVRVVMVPLLLNGYGCLKPKVHRGGILSALEAFVSVENGFKSKMAELGGPRA